MESPPLPGLYIVPTPIGNLGDVTKRSADVLALADVIAVEDSRVTAKLLHHLGLKKPMVPYHDHSKEADRERLIARMADEIVVLVGKSGSGARVDGAGGVVLELGDVIGLPFRVWSGWGFLCSCGHGGGVDCVSRVLGFGAGA